MTDEDLDKLIEEVAEQLEQFSDKPEEPLNKDERKRRALLMAEGELLDRIKKAREKGSFNQEVKAAMDYNLLKEYGDKHPLLMNFMKSQMSWFGW